MIQAKGRTEDGKPLFVFGLSGQNLRQIRQGWPLRIDLAEVGLEGVAIFFYDSTEPARPRSEDPTTHPIHFERG